MKLSAIPAVFALTIGFAALGGLAAQPALASHGGGSDVRVAGSCSAGSTAKLKAKPDDGRLQIEFEVDSNKVGQTWAVSITDNTVGVFAGNRVTTAPSGSFEAKVLAPNRAGTDSIVTAARNVATGERCTASLRI